MEFSVNCTLEVPDEKNPENLVDYSFESVVLGTSKEKVSYGGEQVTKTFFLVYDDKGKEFAWIDSANCEFSEFVD